MTPLIPVSCPGKTAGRQEDVKPRSERHRSVPWFLILWLAGISAVWGGETNSGLFRIGFSSATFADVNESDAIAALKVWAKVMARERNIPVDPQPQVLKGLEQISQAMRNHQVDALALNTDEFWKLRSQLDGEEIIAGVNNGEITEQYIVLVQQESTIQGVQDLRGRSVALLKNSRMSLANVWIDTLFAEQGLPESTGFCQISEFPKLTKVVIPVFFKQVDACVVNLRGFQTMCELNPQMRRQLRIIATSPPYVPSGFCFRRDYKEPVRKTLTQELEKLVSTPAGAQVLTLFQSGAIKAQPATCLDPAFEMLNRHAQLRGLTNSSPPLVQ